MEVVHNVLFCSHNLIIQLVSSVIVIMTSDVTGAYMKVTTDHKEASLKKNKFFGSIQWDSS